MFGRATIRLGIGPHSSFGIVLRCFVSVVRAALSANFVKFDRREVVEVLRYLLDKKSHRSLAVASARISGR